MTPSPGVEPGPHWWEASALTTAPSPLLPSSIRIRHHRCLKVYHFVYRHCLRYLLILNWQLLTCLTFLLFPHQVARSFTFGFRWSPAVNRELPSHVPWETHAGMVSEVVWRNSSVCLAGENIGSKLECRTLRSAGVMASWTDHEDQINPLAPIRPGFIKFLFVNTIKFEQDQYKRHVFSRGTRRIVRRNLIDARLRSGNQWRVLSGLN